MNRTGRSLAAVLGAVSFTVALNSFCQSAASSPIKVLSAKRTETFVMPSGGRYAHPKEDVVLVLEIAGISLEEFGKEAQAKKVYLIAGERRFDYIYASSVMLNGKPQRKIAVIVPRKGLEFKLFVGDYPPMSFKAEDKIYNQLSYFEEPPQGGAVGGAVGGVPQVPALSVQSGSARHEFVAVLIDDASKKPVASARFILAPKKVGKHECTIDTSLTGVSNERGEVRIPNVEPGEYVFFYNLSGSLKPALKGKVVTYGGPHDPRYYSALAESLCPCITTKGGSAVTFDGGLSIANAGLESREEFDIRMITAADGGLLTVRVPSAGGSPVRIEIGLPRPSKSGN